MTDEAAGRLANVLGQENEALARVDYAAAAALLPDKEAALAALTQSPRPPIETLLRLGELANANRDLLERAIEVQTNVLRLVAQACAPPPAMAHYSRHGTKAPSQRTEALALSARI